MTDKQKAALYKKLGIEADGYRCTIPDDLLEQGAGCPDTPLPRCPDDTEEGEYSCPHYCPDYPEGDALLGAYEQALIDRGYAWEMKRDNGMVGITNGAEYSCRVWTFAPTGKLPECGRSKLAALEAALWAAFGEKT